MTKGKKRISYHARKKKKKKVKVVEDLALGGEKKKKNPWFMAQRREGAKGIYSPISVSPF